MTAAPTTKAEWWANLEKHWDDLYEICFMFLPTYENLDWEKKVTETSLGQNILLAKKARDGHALARYFNAAWWNAPDDRSIHSIPSWGVLCDLCSEEWCLYEDEEGEEQVSSKVDQMVNEMPDSWSAKVDWRDLLDG